MAFFRKAGSILGRSVSNHISSRDITISKPSIFQAVRWMSSSKVFIGGISYSTDDSSLREAFSKYGEVSEAKVIVDRETGRSRGFGFVTFTSAEEASASIQAMDQQELHGRQIRVAYANDRTRGYGGGGGGGGYNRGYGGGGSYGSDYGGNYGGGGGGGGYGGNYNSGGGGGYNNNDGYGGGSNYNSGVGSYGSAGGTNDGYDRQNIGAADSNDYFGSGVDGSGVGGSSAGSGFDGFGGGPDKSSGGDSFGDDEGNNLRGGDDVDNYTDQRN